MEQLPVDRARLRETLEAYNAAVGSGAFDPTVRDGLGTKGLALPKSNWAQRLDTPPFTAWPVTGGITFTFGGVKVDAQAQVQSTSWTPIPGLYACGEMVGGLFHGNYPGRHRADVGRRLRPDRRRQRGGSVIGAAEPPRCAS